MERKTFAAEIKAIDEDRGIVTAYVAAFNNIDHQGDRILPGAFTKSLQTRPSIPMLSQHDAQGPANVAVIGKWTKGVEDDHGLLMTGKVSLKTQAGREHFELMKEGMLNQFSIGYKAVSPRFTDVEGKSVRELPEIELYEGSVVIFPANEQATLVGVKAQLSTAAIDDLPDSDFAYIEPGGEKDGEGKTTPRSLRHFPIHDEAHVRNALARAPQSPFGPKAMPKILAAAKRLGIDVSDHDDDDKMALDAIESALDVAAAWLLKLDEQIERETKAGRRNSSADQSRIQVVHDMAHQMTEQMHALGAECPEDAGYVESTEGMSMAHRYLPMTAKQAAEMVAQIVVARI